MAKPASDIRTALGRSALFKTLAPAALARLAESVKTLELRRGTSIYRRGERCPALYIVLSGRVMLRVGTCPDASKVIDLIGAGGHFGLAAAVLEAPQGVTAETLIDSKLLAVPRAALLDQAAANAQLGLQIAMALSRESIALTDDIEAYALHSGRQRVASYLLQIAAANAAKSRPFPLPAKKSIIASRLALTPEYFSRMLKDLIVAGTIVVEGRQITILNVARLRDCGSTDTGAAPARPAAQTSASLTP